MEAVSTRDPESGKQFQSPQLLNESCCKQSCTVGIDLTTVPNGNDVSSEGRMSSDPAEKIVKDLIERHPVIVFSKTWCPFCEG